MRAFSQRFGAEFVFHFGEEQPSFSGLFNSKIGKYLEVSALASLYGNVALLTTASIRSCKVSSFFDANLLTLESKYGLGLQWQFRNLTSNISFFFPAKTVAFGWQFNGISGFWPMSFNAHKKPSGHDDNDHD
jgi:hypothetical protein